MRRNRLLCLYLTVCMFLSGCGNTAAATVQGQPQSDNISVQTVSQPLYQSEVTYELPVSRVRVLWTERHICQVGIRRCFSLESIFRMSSYCRGAVQRGCLYRYHHEDCI